MFKDVASLGEPQSRNEMLLMNALGSDYDLGEPQSRNEVLLMELVEAIKGGGGGGGDSYTKKETDAKFLSKTEAAEVYAAKADFIEITAQEVAEMWEAD